MMKFKVSSSAGILFLLFLPVFLAGQKVNLAEYLITLKSEASVRAWAEANRKFVTSDRVYALVNYAYDRMYSQDGRINDAILLCENTFIVSQYQNDLSATAWSQLQKGRILHYTGKTAKPSFDRALELYKKAGDLHGEANCYFSLADIMFDTGDYRIANVLYEKALQVYKKQGSFTSEANCYLRQGDIASRTGDNKAASELYEKALVLYKKEGSSLGEANCYKEQGIIASRTGDDKAASELYEKALVLYKKEGSYLGEAHCYFFKGNIAFYANDYRTADELYEKAMPLYIKVGYSVGEANGYFFRGRIASHNGHIDAANELYNKAMLLYRMNGTSLSEANCYVMQGKNKSDAGDNRTANELYEKALGLYKKMDDSHSIGGTYYYMALSSFSKEVKGSWKAAEENIGHAVAYMEKARARAGSTKQKTEFFAKQTAIYKKAVEIEFYMNNIEKAYSFAEAGRARGLLDEVSQNIIFTSPEIDNLDIKPLKEVKEKIADLTGLIAAKRKADKAYTDDESALFKLQKEYETALAALYRKYPKYAQLCASKITGLQEVQKLLGKDETFILYSIGISNSVQKSEDAGSVVFVITATTAKMIALPREDFDIANTVETFRSMLTAVSGDAYYLMDEKTKNFQVGRGLKVQKTDKKSEMKKVGSGEALELVNKRLYDFLIAPIMPHIKSYDDIIISPDAELALIPFEAIRDKAGKYLAQTMNISYIQSGSILAKVKAVKPRSRALVLAFGGAVYDKTAANSPKLVRELTDAEKEYYKEKSSQYFAMRESMQDVYGKMGYIWSPLPGTKDEVVAIGGLYYPKDSVDYKNSVFTGGKVTEERLKEMSRIDTLKNYRIIHFATHGLADTQVPELSAIVLSQPNANIQKKEDGYLTVPEILILNLDAGLVNLSACQTGLGRIVSGEGVTGLTQSFIMAGSQNVCVSLWSVADVSTRDFMISFYTKVKDGKSYKDAISQTRREFIDKGKFKEPLYWAPFVLYGE